MGNGVVAKLGVSEVEGPLHRTWSCVEISASGARTEPRGSGNDTPTPVDRLTLEAVTKQFDNAFQRVPEVPEEVDDSIHAPLIADEASKRNLP